MERLLRSPDDDALLEDERLMTPAAAPAPPAVEGPPDDEDEEAEELLLLLFDILDCLDGGSFPPLDFMSSAASALEMFSCFFHFVRRFWNQILTWGREEGDRE